MTPSAAWKLPAVWSSAASHPLKGAEWHHLDSGRLSSAVLWGCLAYGKESPISTHPTGVHDICMLEMSPLLVVTAFSQWWKCDGFASSSGLVLVV